MEVAAFKWLDMFNRGKITVEVDTSDLGRSIAGINDIGRQATVGIDRGRPADRHGDRDGDPAPARADAFQSFAYVAMIAFGLTLFVSFVVLFRMLTGRGSSGGDRG